MHSDDKLACITLDLENDWYFDQPGYDHLTFDHIEEYIEMIRSKDLPVSIFVVGETIERYPEEVGRLQEELETEFHLHSYRHDISKSHPFEEEVRLGTDAFEMFFDREPQGYRAPQGNITDEEINHLDQEGFDFDSSIFPSYRPGVYNNLGAPLTPYRHPGTDLVEFPFAAVPWFRVPITQSYLKLLGKSYMKFLKRSRLPNPLIFDTHLQDFFKTRSHDQLGQPLRFIHHRNLHRSKRIFSRFIKLLRRRGYSFVRMSELYDKVSERL